MLLGRSGVCFFGSVCKLMCAFNAFVVVSWVCIFFFSESCIDTSLECYSLSNSMDPIQLKSPELYVSSIVFLHFY